MKTILIEKSKNSVGYAVSNSNRIRLVVSVAVLIVALLGMMPSRAATAVSDNFSTGTAGSTLNGNAPSFYNSSYYGSSPLWTATGISHSTPIGTAVSTIAYANASIAVPNFPASLPNATLTVQATMTLNNCDWMSLNFFGASAPSTFDTTNPINLFLDSTGTLYTLKNGYQDILGSVTISNFSKTQAYTLKAVYDLAHGTVSSYINGLLVGTYTVGSLNGTAINSAGFVLNGSGGRAVDFSYSATDYSAAAVADAFSTGTAGSTLNGSAPSFYNSSYYGSSPLWTATGINHSTPIGTAVSTTAYANASIAVPNFPASQPNATLTLQATMTLNNCDWMSLNFFGASTPSTFDTTNPINLFLDSTGTLYTLKNGYQDILGSVTISGFSKTQAYTLKAVYDIANGTVSSYVNGSLVGTYTVGSLNGTAINSAGFVLNGSGGSAGDFSYSATGYSNSIAITINPNTVINSDFFGIGVNIFPFSLMANNLAQDYNNAYWEMDKKRISAMKIPFARVEFQIDWMEPTKGVYTWNSDKMMAFYKYMDALKAAGTEVEFNFGWKVGTAVQSWFSIPGVDSSISAPADLTAYAAACSACLNQLINVKGYTNLKYLTFYNEPSGNWDFECLGDQKAYYAAMVRAVDTQLKADNRRTLVKIWGPEDCSGGTDWFSYMYNNAGTCFNGYTFHDYGDTYNSLTSHITNLLGAVGNNPIFMTEIGYQTENQSGWAGGYSNFLIGSANKGVSGLAVWTLNGVYAEDPGSGSLNGDNWNLWDSLPKGGIIPHQSYYEVSMLSRYIPAHSKVISAITSGTGIRTAAFKTIGGDYTIVVESNDGNGNNLNINFSGVNIGKTFTKHVYKKDITKEGNALIPVSCGTFSSGISFTDSEVSSTYSVIVYTTLPSQTQVAVSPISPTPAIPVGGTIQLNASVIDNSGGVTWSVASGGGTVNSSGLYMASPNVVTGDMIAVRATSVNDTTAYGIALIKIY